MASPIIVYIRECTLRIELQQDDRSDASDKLPPNSDAKQTCIKYRAVNTAEELRTTSGKIYRGYFPPTSRVTLPKMIKRKADIPDNAAYYSFIHPPTGLINDMDVIKPLEENEKGVHSNAMIDIAVYGGYVYFDADGEVIRINAISMQQSKLKLRLRFSGPFHVGKVVCNVLRQLYHPKPFVHEAPGFVR